MANIFVTEFSETSIDTCINADVNDDKGFRFGQGFTGNYCNLLKLYRDQLEMNALLAECAHLTTYQSNFLHFHIYVSQENQAK